MPSAPLAYHITISTYGCRLHGDDRGTVDRDHNTPSEPFLGPDPARIARERGRMRYSPVVLSIAQRAFVEEQAGSIAGRGGWTLHTVAAAPDHVHALISADVEGNVVRRLWKRWLSEALSKHWPTADETMIPLGTAKSSDLVAIHESRGPGVWWAEGGSVKWIWDSNYLRRAFDYIAAQRANELLSPRISAPNRLAQRACAGANSESQNRNSRPHQQDGSTSGNPA